MSIDSEISASEDLLGKSVTDLQTNVVVNPSNVTGTLKYVEDYTGFSSDPELQSGHYLVLHAESTDADKITVEVVGGISGPVTLDSDGIAVLRIVNTNTQLVRIVASKDGVTSTRTLSLKKLRLEQKA